MIKKKASVKLILACLEEVMSKKRLDHCCRVAQTAKQLAKHYNLDEEIVEYSAMLHDISKEVSLEMFDHYQVVLPDPIKELYSTFPKVAHAFSGPLLIKQFFEPLDQRVYDACMWHTTGKADMTDYESLIYVADFCDPHRQGKDTAYYLSVAKENLNQAVAEIALVSLRHLIDSKAIIHPFSLQCYNSALVYLN